MKKKKKKRIGDSAAWRDVASAPLVLCGAAALLVSAAA